MRSKAFHWLRDRQVVKVIRHARTSFADNIPDVDKAPKWLTSHTIST